MLAAQGAVEGLLNLRPRAVVVIAAFPLNKNC